MAGSGWGRIELLLKPGRGDGGVYGRTRPYDLASASTPRSNSSRLGSLTSDFVVASRRMMPGRGEQSLKALECDPVSKLARFVQGRISKDAGTTNPHFSTEGYLTSTLVEFEGACKAAAG